MPEIRETILAWVTLSRPTFHSVGLLPFILGGVLSWSYEGVLRWDIFGLGAMGLVFAMLAAYYGGEYWDYVEDTLSARMGSSRFAGGSQAIQRGLIPRYSALRGSFVSLSLSLLIALVLQFGYGTGSWTIAFCVLGLMGGFFYSAPPFRWIGRGLGELWIAFCFGFLPVAAAFYLQTGELIPSVYWFSVPIGLTIFNVILLNEFLDYEADRSAGKSNLVVRIGRQSASMIYGITSFGSWVLMILSFAQGLPSRSMILYAPVLAMSLLLVILVMRGYWQDRTVLEKLCAANLAANLGTTAVYILALIVLA